MDPIVLNILDKKIEKVKSELHVANGLINQHVYGIVLDTLNSVRTEYVRESERC